MLFRAFHFAVKLTILQSKSALASLCMVQKYLNLNQALGNHVFEVSFSILEDCDFLLLCNLVL